MEIGNGCMPSFEIPKYEGNGVKGKTCKQREQADLGQQFPQEDDEEKVLKGPQEIEGNGNFEKPNVHRIDPLRIDKSSYVIMFLSEFRPGFNENPVWNFLASFMTNIS